MKIYSPELGIELPVFEIELGANLAEKAVGLSLVDVPAIGSNWLALSAADAQAQAVEVAERRMLYGPAMIPGRPIFRQRIEGYADPCYIVFSEATVRQMAQDFMATPGTRALTLMHADPIDGAHIAESWVIENPETDKSAALGLTGLPAGTWMVGVKVKDSYIWADMVKQKRLNGFSLEFASWIEKALRINQPLTKPKTKPMSFLSKWLTPKRKPKNLAASGIPANIGGVDALVMIDESGMALMVPVAGGEVVPVPDGEYEVGDGVLKIESGMVKVGEAVETELEASDYVEYTADFGKVNLPQGFSSAELFDAAGNLQGKLTFQAAEGGQDNPAEGTAPAEPLEVAALRAQVAALSKQVATLSAKSKTPAPTGTQAAPDPTGPKGKGVTLSADEAIVKYREIKQANHKTK